MSHANNLRTCHAKCRHAQKQKFASLWAAKLNSKAKCTAGSFFRVFSTFFFFVFFWQQTSRGAAQLPPVTAMCRVCCVPRLRRLHCRRQRSPLVGMCKSKNEVAQNFLICLRNFIKTTKLQQSAKCLEKASTSTSTPTASATATRRLRDGKGRVELAKQNTVKRSLQLNLAIAFLALLPPIQLDSICVPAADSYTRVATVSASVCVCVCANELEHACSARSGQQRDSRRRLALCVFKWQCKWQHFGEHFTLFAPAPASRHAPSTSLTTSRWQLHDIFCFLPKLFVLNLIAMKISIHLQCQLVKVHWQLLQGCGAGRASSGKCRGKQPGMSLSLTVQCVCTRDGVTD